MRNIIKLIIAPISSLIIIMLGISYLNTFISLRVTADGYPSFITGVLYSFYYLGMMIGAFYLEKIIHLKGHIRSFSMFAGGVSAILLIQSFTQPPYTWILFRFFTGMLVAGLFIVIESWLLLLACPKTRGSVLALYMIAIYTAQSFGQFGINLVPIHSMQSFNLALIFCTASIIPVCIMKAAAPSLHEAEIINVFYLFKKIPLGFLGNFTSGLILGAFYALGPVYAKNSGYSLIQISMVMAVTIFGGMGLQWPIGKLSDIFPRRYIIILVCAFICSISLLLVFFHESSYNMHLLLLFILGGFVFTLYPISITYCCDFFSSSGLTSVTAAALLIFGSGCIIGPIIAPLFMVIGPEGLFLYIALFAFLLTFFAVYRQHTAPPPPPETKENYQVHPGLSGNLSDSE
ncbi:MAG: putative MFS-type transporter YcaD [Chlamydiia bacterium]|nr:putative MFS-type transporter YcaD [Chlamydiia bacterium]MCH9618718.1 putative MFS-type transporter YcaD [Chlamydiia bacterium]MCH9624398.1 putative MFS-type transporter YcaD [Chlamydiia bacterium]